MRQRPERERNVPKAREIPLTASDYALAAFAAQYPEHRALRHAHEYHAVLDEYLLKCAELHALLNTAEVLQVQRQRIAEELHELL